LTFERERANHEALITYERLAKLSPHEAAFHAACAQLYERAGRPEDAKKAWAKAKELGYVGMDR
jgi:Flp pilus assembly protein TadD